MGFVVEWEEVNKPKFVGYFCCANLFESILYYPFWALKTREQLTKESISSRQLIQDLIRQRQLGSLYKGFWSGTILCFPSYLVYFLIYQKTKHALSNLSGDR
jgi:hypothetical protein